MEKIIFFVLVIPIMAYVLYLGGMAIMNGFKSKEANRAQKEESERDINIDSADRTNNLSEELNKLNDLREKGIISQKKLEKAKKKLLDN